LLQKVAIIGAIWVGTIFVSAIMLTPILLSLIKRPNHHAHRLDLETGMRWLLGWCFRVTTGKPRYLVVGIAVAIFVVSGLLAFQVTVGDAHSGSPILRPNSVYNRSAAAINSHYPGANRMFVVVHGDQKGALRKPAVLKNMAQFQRDMAIQPEVGGTESLKDVIAATNQSLHGGDPRYYDIANTARRNGQFLYIYFSHSAESAIRQYADPKYQNAAITLFFQNHTGKTIRTAFHNIQQYISNHPMKHASYELAGGFIGVMAAVNNVLLRGQMEAVALGLLVVVLCAMLVYRSTAAGLYFMAPVLLSNTVTFAYMSFNHIGLNINTVPVVALGIGLGVDYSFYIADGIRDQLREHGNVKLAIQGSLFSAGRGVFVTGLTLVATVFLWTFSSLRFQAEMAKLIALWLSVSAISALILMPAIAYIFRPRFIFGGQGDSGQEGVEESGIRTASE
jgi:predicted RND superfamily exporter protein